MTRPLIECLRHISTRFPWRAVVVGDNGTPVYLPMMATADEAAYSIECYYRLKGGAVLWSDHLDDATRERVQAQVQGLLNQQGGVVSDYKP
jgi:hypothetical protein